MATCTVTVTVNTAAVSGRVAFEPFPGQIIDGTAIDSARVTASVTGANTYAASLIQKARYRIVSPGFGFDRSTFVVPASGAANLGDLMEGGRGF